MGGGGCCLRHRARCCNGLWGSLCTCDGAECGVQQCCTVFMQLAGCVSLCGHVCCLVGVDSQSSVLPWVERSDVGLFYLCAVFSKIECYRGVVQAGRQGKADKAGRQQVISRRNKESFSRAAHARLLPNTESIISRGERPEQARHGHVSFVSFLHRRHGHLIVGCWLAWFATHVTNARVRLRMCWAHTHVLGVFGCERNCCGACGDLIVPGPLLIRMPQLPQ